MQRFVLCALAFLAACGGKVFVDTPGTTSTGASGASTTGAGGTGAGGGESCDSCNCCACELLVSEGGCKDLCSTQVEGPSTPNFCDGAMALPMCAACIASTCGMPDPTGCN